MQNLALATLAGAFVYVSPFTPPDALPSLLAGAAVGLGVYVWRVREQKLAAAAAGAEAMEIPQEAPIDWAALFSGRLLLVWSSLLLLAVVFAPTGDWMYRKWTSSIWQNAHGLFVPFVMVYLARAALTHDPHPEKRESSAWGFVFIITGLGLLAFDSAIATRFLASIGLVLCLPGLSLLFLGARRTRLLLVPLTLGIFMIPIPNSVATHLYLKSMSAMAVEPLIWLTGIPVLREHTQLILPDRVFVVGDACSGFATLYAATGVSIILACYSGSTKRRLMLLAAAVPLALIANIARVFLLVMMAHFFGIGLLDTPLHEASGVFTFWGVLAALFLLAGNETLKDAFA